MPDDPALRIFPDEYVPNAEGVPYHGKWVRANSTEAIRWATFRDAVIAGQQVTPPSMATKYGRALVAAGKEHMSMSHFLGTVVPPSPPVPPGGGSVPPAIEGQGYSVTFSDDFATLDLGNQNKWSNGIWYSSPAPPAGMIYAQDGKLHLVSKLGVAPHYPSVTTLWNSGTGGQSFLYGYFEARMRWDNAVGAWPAFWLLSTLDRYGQNAAVPDTAWCSEFDIFEGYRDQGGYYGPTAFTGTLHKNTGGRFSVPDEVKRAGGAGDYVTVADMTTGFHTYAGLWTPTQISWYFDDVLLNSVTPFTSTPQLMFLILSMQQIQDGSMTVPEMHLEVDWVKVWQK